MKDELKNIYVEKIKKFNISKTKKLNSVITPSEIYIGESKYSPIGEIRLLNKNYFIANFQDEYFDGCLNEGFRGIGNLNKEEAVQVWYMLDHQIF